MALGSCSGWAVRWPHLLPVVERHQGEESYIDVPGNGLVAHGRSSRMAVDSGVRFGEGWFRMVESRETRRIHPEDSPCSKT